jgi:hypothetical protein
VQPPSHSSEGRRSGCRRFPHSTSPRKFAAAHGNLIGTRARDGSSTGNSVGILYSLWGGLVVSWPNTGKPVDRQVISRSSGTQYRSCPLEMCRISLWSEAGGAWNLRVLSRSQPWRTFCPPLKSNRLKGGLSMNHTSKLLKGTAPLLLGVVGIVLTVSPAFANLMLTISVPNASRAVRRRRSRSPQKATVAICT